MTEIEVGECNVLPMLKKRKNEKKKKETKIPAAQCFDAKLSLFSSCRSDSFVKRNRVLKKKHWFHQSCLPLIGLKRENESSDIMFE